MKFKTNSVLILLFLLTLKGFSQTTDEEDGSFLKDKSKSKFHYGLYFGSYFANQHTANMYDGYGYDFNGVKNDFQNSFMYRKIIVEYGGGNGQPDQIAQSLNLNPGDWSFDKSDMPLKMRYNPAFMVGLQGRYSVGKKSALLLSVNASKISLNGNFTIHILNSPIGPLQPNFQNLQIFSITGSEQRIVFQMGLQRIFGDSKKPINFIIEGGPSMTLVKFTKNQLHINNLLIDLMTYYNEQGMEIYRAKLLTGVGFGAFAGMGLNLNVNPYWTLQILYNPSYDRIAMGSNPKPTLQHALGLKVYYDL